MNDSPSEAETSFQQAVEAFNSSNLDLAIDLFKTTISLGPDHADAYNYLGQAYFKKEEYQNSVDCFNKALEIEPTHTQARENLEVAQWRLGRLDSRTPESSENVESESIENVNEDTKEEDNLISEQRRKGKGPWYTFLGSTLALIIGWLGIFSNLTHRIMMVLKQETPSASDLARNPMFGLYIVLGTLAYRSCKRTKMGLRNYSLIRRGIEIGVICLIIIDNFLLQKYMPLTNRIFDNSATNFTFPIWVIVAYVIVLLRKPRSLLTQGTYQEDQKNVEGEKETEGKANRIIELLRLPRSKVILFLILVLGGILLLRYFLTEGSLTKTFETSEINSIRFPRKWKKEPLLSNSSADIQVTHKSKDLSFMLITEHKAPIAMLLGTSLSLFDYAKERIKRLLRLDEDEDGRVREFKTTRLYGYDVLQSTVVVPTPPSILSEFGPFENVSDYTYYSYFYVFVEDLRAFHQLIFMCPLSKLDENKDLFLDIAGTFQTLHERTNSVLKLEKQVGTSSVESILFPPSWAETDTSARFDLQMVDVSQGVDEIFGFTQAGFALYSKPREYSVSGLREFTDEILNEKSYAGYGAIPDELDAFEISGKVALKCKITSIVENVSVDYSYVFVEDPKYYHWMMLFCGTDDVIFYQMLFPEIIQSFQTVN